MKNVILLFSLIFSGGTALAQYALPLLQEAKTQSYNNLSLRSASSESTDTIMFEDFANGVPDGWNNDGWEYRGPNTDPSSDVGSIGAYSGIANNPPTNDPVASASSANGFMIFDSDYYDNNGVAGSFGTGSNPTPHLGTLTSAVFDCSQHENVVVEFNSYFRRFAGQVFLQFSADSGTTWSEQVEIHPETEIDVNEGTDIDYVFRRKSNEIANSENARIRFIFDGSSNELNGYFGYYFWMIDDIIVKEAPSYDMELSSAYINMTGSGMFPFSNEEETIGFRDYYGQTPLNQVTDIEFGISGLNFGTENQNNIKSIVNVDLSGNTIFSDTVTYEYVYADSTFSVFHEDSWFLPSETGVYTCEFLLSTDSLDATDYNNNTQYTFSITDTVFAADNNMASGSIGTSSFTDGADGLKLANLYQLETEDELTSVSLSLGSATVSGGFLQVTVFDTTGFYSSNVENPILYSDFYTVTDADVTAGEILIPIPTTYSGLAQNRVLPIGGYMVCVELYSNAEANTITILDDASYTRWYGSSMIFIPGAQWYSNGNALHIRANFGDWAHTPVNIEEEFINSMNVFPNPSSGFIKVNFNSNFNNDAQFNVYDLTGKLVYNQSLQTYSGINNHEIQLNHLKNGFYIVKINNEKSEYIGKINIIK